MCKQHPLPDGLPCQPSVDFCQQCFYRDGCCLALSAKWLETKKNNTDFKASLDPQLLNQQSLTAVHLALNNTSQSGGADEYMKQNHASQFTKANDDRDFTRKDKQPDVANVALRAFGSKSREFKLLRFMPTGGGDGHAMGIYRSNEGVTFFDPNFGEFKFKLNEWINFASLLTSLMNKAYPGEASFSLSTFSPC